MSWNTFGRVLRFTTWGESHGPAIGAVVDGCPPGLALSEADIQPFLDARKPGQNKYTTQRQEADLVRILSGTFEGKTTGTPIALMIENTDQRSKDYSEIANTYRPGHADYAYDAKYGFRDYRGGGRSSARETASRVAAGAVARLAIPEVTITAYVAEIGGDRIDPANFDTEEIARNPFWCPDAAAAKRWEATTAGAGSPAISTLPGRSSWLALPRPSGPAATMSPFRAIRATCLRPIVRSPAGISMLRCAANCPQPPSARRHARQNWLPAASRWPAVSTSPRAA